MSYPHGDEQAQYQPPPPGYPPPGYAPPGYPPGYRQPTDGLAIASLVLGIVGLGIGSILAVIFGHVALGRIERQGTGGRGLAIAGLVLGYLGIAGLVFTILVFAVAASSSSFSG